MPLPRRSLMLAAAAALAACGDDPTEPEAGAPALVVIEGNPALLAVGDTVRLGARAYDADGRLVLRDAPVSWRALDTGLVRVDAGGVVTGWEGGTARVVAAVGAAADTATLRIDLRVDSIAFEVVNPFSIDGLIRPGNLLSLRATPFDGRGRPFAIGAIAFGVADTTIASAPTVPANSMYGQSTARRAGTTAFSAEFGGVRATRTIEVVASTVAPVAEGTP